MKVFDCANSAADLGMYKAYTDKYYTTEVVHTQQLAYAVAIVPTYSKRLGSATPLWIIHSFNQVCFHSKIYCRWMCMQLIH